MMADVTPRKLYNFYIDPELAEGLKKLKALDGAPESESVRRALRAYLEKKGAIKTDRKRAVTRNRP
jgi:ribbon-helix-helix CopG family protein